MAGTRFDRWLVRPGHAPALAKRDPSSTDGAPGDRVTTEAATESQVPRMAALQDRLWAEGRHSVLVVLQGIDASGKDGTIKHVFRGVNPQGVRVASFKVPTPAEQAHDFLWRVHHETPAAGEIGIFNRSHYEDLVVPRVHRSMPASVWRARYAHISGFERLLDHAGTRLVKVFLHISFEEQGRRLAERLQRPDKRWKMGPADVAERAHWDAYLEAYEEMLERTSIDEAPWYVIPADHKWFRNWVVTELLLHTLEDLDPQYPAAPPR